MWNPNRTQTANTMLPFGGRLGSFWFSTRPHCFFFIHIFKRQYDKNYQKVYHIAFYHILKISKSLSYSLYHISKFTKKCSFSAIFPKFYHIAVYHILKNFIIFSLSYFNMIKSALYHIFLDFWNMIKKCQIWIKKNQCPGPHGAIAPVIIRLWVIIEIYYRW